jgi:MinD superfamily P-loop ATPase
MRVAIASGKGGTGKTTVSASLVSVWDGPVTAVDLDVEEPNLHLFLNPVITGRETATLEVPVVDETKCTHCGACADLCQFKAISDLGTVLLTFPEMCHGCGGCMAVCPENALKPGARELGQISWGRAGGAGFLMGRLRVGEAMSPPLMRAVRRRLADMLAVSGGDAVIDAPPGVSCPAVNAVMDSDLVLLVTEPTPFGFYDLKLAHQAFGPMGTPMAVVVNRAGVGSADVYEYCDAVGLAIVAEIPYQRRIAEAYANGQILAQTTAGMQAVFESLTDRIRTLATAEVRHG